MGLTVIYFVGLCLSFFIVSFVAGEKNMNSDLVGFCIIWPITLIGFLLIGCLLVVVLLLHIPIMLGTFCRKMLFGKK